MMDAVYMVCFLWTVSCAQGGDDYQLPYDLNRPVLSITISDRLEEISGLEMISDSVILAIQDEEAIVFSVHPQSGQIIDQYDFGKDDDYEGIAKYKNSQYILRSDGSIFKSKPGKETKTYKFEGSKDFDFEGLCLDSSRDRLLVACKAHGNKDKRDHFYIYAFSLKSKEYKKKPVFKISKGGVLEGFRPSAIAIHPDRNIYVLSSFSKTLLVMDNNGTILAHVKLNENIFYQPEGITFSKEGDLFISNEKNDRTPNILKFKQTI